MVMFSKIDDLMELLGDFDVGQAKDTVDAPWNDQDKITETVNLVRDNRDAIAEAIESPPSAPPLSCCARHLRSSVL